MRQILVCFFISLSATVYSQTFREMNPALGRLIDKSVEGETEFQKQKEHFDALSEIGYKKLSEENKKFFDSYSDNSTYETYWDVIGAGCSWYCGGWVANLTASSELSPYRNVNYSAKNAHDFSYKTAWIPEEPYGIGEYLTYYFREDNPRITKIIIVNGYVKSDKAWNENSRVKKLKMYVNDKPYAMLNLQDTKREQIFAVEPIGNGNRADIQANRKEIDKLPLWTIKFEIDDVYIGDKYLDTALTQIYFDGIDVH